VGHSRVADLVHCRLSTGSPSVAKQKDH
jgi:hypothetical protein